MRNSTNSYSTNNSSTNNKRIKQRSYVALVVVLLLSLLLIILLQLLIKLDRVESAEQQSMQIIEQMPFALVSSNTNQAMEHKSTLSDLKMHNALRFTAGAPTKHLPRKQATKEATSRTDTHHQGIQTSSKTDTVAMKVSEWEQKFLLNMPN